MKAVGFFFLFFVFALEGCHYEVFRTVHKGADERPSPPGQETERSRAKPIPTIPIPDRNDLGDDVQIIPGGGKFCEDYLIKQSRVDRAADLALQKLDKSSIDGKINKPPLSEWIISISDPTVLHAHEIYSGGRNATFLVTPNSASGLAVNYRNWYLEVDGRPVSFVSLSENPSLIYWDRQGSLKFYRVDFTKDFIIDKNWNNVRVNVFLYRWEVSGEYRLISEERNLACR